MASPGEDIQAWSKVADDNGNIDPKIDWHEHQTRASVNNSSRSELAAHAKDRDLNNYSIVTTGAPNAQNFLSGCSYVSMPPRIRARLKVGPGLNNTAGTTLNMDGIGDIQVKTTLGTTMRGGEFAENNFVNVIYDGTNWILEDNVLHSAVLSGDPIAVNPTDPLDDDNSVATTHWVQELVYGGEGIVISQKVFSSAGTFSYVPSSAMKSCLIECIGGGGGGGAAYSAVAQYQFGGGGGGSGGYSRRHATATDVGVSQPVVVGAGGTGGIVSPAAGNGGATYVGNVGTELCRANGGAGGHASSQVDGVGQGGAGGAVWVSGNPAIVSIGGTPGATGAYDTDPSTGSVFSAGDGAPGPLGGGASAIGGSPGMNASGYGAGGAGGHSYATAGQIAGGVGSSGLVIITEFAGRGAVGPAGPVGPIGPTGPAGAGTGDVLRSGTPVAGQIAQWTDASHIQGIDLTTSTALPAPHHGRLTYVSPTQLKFAPFNGNKIKINGVLYNIPNAGIAGLATTGAFVNGVGSSSLTGTGYYIYAFNNGGTITADFRNDGNGHITDTTAGNEGVEVRCSSGTTPDPTRTLIGTCVTNASAQFIFNASNCAVLSWFNRRRITSTVYSTVNMTVGLTTGVWAEVSSAFRINFLGWADDSPMINVQATATAANFSVTFEIVIDTTAGTAAPIASTTFFSSGPSYPLNMTSNATLNEGQHYAAVIAVGNSSGNASITLGVGAVQPLISATVMG